MERAEAEAIYDQSRETVVAVLLRLDEQIQQLTKQVAKQGEEIAELKRRLNRNSRNSSTPPSQDPPVCRSASDSTRPGGRKALSPAIGARGESSCRPRR